LHGFASNNFEEKIKFIVLNKWHCYVSQLCKREYVRDFVPEIATRYGDIFENDGDCVVKILDVGVTDVVDELFVRLVVDICVRTVPESVNS
jgi:hypothetical protein